MSCTSLVNVILLRCVIFLLNTFLRIWENHACDIKIVATFCLNIRTSVCISTPFPFHISNSVNVLEFPVGCILGNNKRKMGAFVTL
jgi:hypothetical protein